MVPSHSPGRSFCLAVMLLLLQAAVQVAAATTLRLSTGQELEVQRFDGGDRALVLWLPSERGLGMAHERHARALAEAGYQVWLVDLHASYFVEHGRSSINRFPLDDLVALIDAAARSSTGGVLLNSSSRGAQLALIAAREWQLLNPGSARLLGAILTHPHLYRARPRAGEQARYLPIADATNLPLYLLESQYSTRSARIRELAEALGSGGSPVYTQVIQGVQGGFFARDDGELDEADRVAKAGYARIMARAIGVLRQSPAPTGAVVTEIDTRVLSRDFRIDSALTPVETAMPAPPLDLDTYRGEPVSPGQFAGKVVLVNFWASWCRPCVEEIPSLHRLRDRIDDPAFSIVTVNVGEGRERIEKFLRRVPIELPMLLDLDSRAAKAWQVYVYPSSYLLDHQGIIRYAYLGALEWDSAENMTIIRRLLTRR